MRQLIPKKLDGHVQSRPLIPTTDCLKLTQVVYSTLFAELLGLRFRSAFKHAKLISSSYMHLNFTGHLSNNGKKISKKQKQRNKQPEKRRGKKENWLK